MILVDTSAWVHFFRGRGAMARQVEAFLEENQLAICGPVVCELRRGIVHAHEREKVLAHLEGCHLLAQPQRLWEDAGDLGRYLARRGVTSKTLDLLIATYSLAHEVRLLTGEKDFKAMAKAGVPLSLVGD